jgi:RimJ/RimL family protein N-acetyltransferase
LNKINNDKICGMGVKAGIPQDLSKVSIKSERLVLRPISLSYAKDIHVEFNENVTKFLSYGPNKNLNATNDFIRESAQKTKNGEKLQLVVTSKEGEFLGLTSIKKTNSQTPSFGLWLKEAAQGNGYGRELIFALTEWAYKNLDFDYIIYRVDAENIGSWKIAEKLIEKYGGETLGEKLEVLRGRKRMMKTYHIFSS